MTVNLSAYIRSNRRKLVPLAALVYLFAFFFVHSSSSFDQSTDNSGSTHLGKSVASRHWLVYANKSECQKKAQRLRIGENTTLLPTTSLLSTQGSGNTWLRWLIERLTGICTGSVYQETLMAKQGFRCELGAVYNGLTIVQKSHYFLHHKSVKFLLLVRYPFDAIVSDYHRSKTAGNHTGVADETAFRGTEWEHFVTVRTGEWYQQISMTLSYSNNFLVVFYENLLTDLGRELGRIAEFLQVNVSRERVECVIRNQEGKLRRKQRWKASNTAFSSAQREFVHKVVARAVTEFRARSVPNIPLLYQRPLSAVTLISLPTIN